jgi:hypothetical protein
MGFVAARADSFRYAARLPRLPHLVRSRTTTLVAVISEDDVAYEDIERNQDEKAKRRAPHKPDQRHANYQSEEVFSSPRPKIDGAMLEMKLGFQTGLNACVALTVAMQEYLVLAKKMLLCTPHGITPRPAPTVTATPTCNLSVTA